MKLKLSLALLAALSLGACNKQTYSLPDDSQSFGQIVKYNTKVDIVMMVDNSSSMSLYQGRLASEIPSMINSLNQKGLDYQIVVVTTDMISSGGRFIGTPKILNSASVNLSSVLSSRVKLGNLGSDNERGLSSVMTALTTETGFLRPDAMLAIIALTNEDDHSPEGNAAYFKAFFDQIKPKQQGWNGFMQGWIVNVIGVLDLASCSSALDGEYREPALKWISLATSSGGSANSICQSTLTSTVANIEKRIVDATTEFLLDRKPKVETIVVKVDNKVIAQSMTNGWEYDATRNLIRFHGTAVPSPTSNISVDFTPAEAM